MALPPGSITESPDGDRKRLMQRADSFSIGSGTREKKDFEEIEEFDEAIDSVLKEARKTQEKEVEEQERDLHAHRESQARHEAERRGSSSPSHQTFLGMSILPGIESQRMLIGQSPESQSKQRSAGVGQGGTLQVESVSHEILQGLKAAGLSEPIVTLDDPRINGAPEGLRKHFVLSLTGTERVYVWSRDNCHQILTVGLRESHLESAVGSVVETVTRKGKSDEKKVSSRVVAEDPFSLG